MEKLIKRQVIDEINRYLNTQDIIVLHGARQVGKTSIMKYLEDSLIKGGRLTKYIDLEDSRLTKILDQGVDEFIKYLQEEGMDQQKIKDNNNKIYIFIDEIQYLTDPSPFLKLIADHHPELKLIVSGSSSFNIKNKFSDSLVGRTVEFEIFNLSFYEFLNFKGEKLKDFFNLTEKKTNQLKIYFKEYALFGGYPKIVLTTDLTIKERYLQQIIDTYVRKDIRDLANIKEINKFNQLLEILASQSGKLLNVTELANTCNLAKQTVEQYLFILEQTYIIKLVRPYFHNLRSEISKTPKIFFYDTGLAQMLWLKSIPKEILGDIFETAVFIELAKKYQPSNIYYWRTVDKKEIDFILKDKQKIIAYEAKLNSAQFKASSLEYFIERNQLNSSFIISLSGNKNDAKFIYPWEI